MHLSAILVSTLAVVARGAPTFPGLGLTRQPNGVDSLSVYFDGIAAKVEAAELLSGPSGCDLSKAHMPSGVDGLPAPAEGLTVRHVAVGRGTQNYTCDAGRADAVPKAGGAVAALFNASCVAALCPELLERIPSTAVRLNEGSGTAGVGARVLARSGVHYFTDSSTAFFNLDTPSIDIGEARCTKDSSVNAPPTAAAGQLGEKAVTWLRLRTKEGGATGGIREVYRVTTAGGSPPATCKGMPATFEVPYAAVYWFWQGEDAGQQQGDEGSEPVNEEIGSEPEDDGDDQEDGEWRYD